jgi:hypothetical protein
MISNFKMLIVGVSVVLLTLPNLYVSTQDNNPLSAFKTVHEIQSPQIPLLNRLYLETEIDLGKGYAIADQNNKVVSSSLTEKRETVVNQVSINSTTPTRGNVNRLIDDKSETFVEFEPVAEISEFVVSYAEPITTTSFNYSYGPNVLQSQFLQIELIEDGKTKQLYDKVYNVGGYASFPEITGKEFKITFYHTNRLQLSEINFDYPASISKSSSRVEWLGEPSNNYKLFTNPDRFVPNHYDVNLYRATDIPQLATLGNNSPNSIYTEQDRDEDGVPDIKDNCPDYSNKEQIDLDKNNLADICEDRDLDGVAGFADNCPTQANTNQSDKDNDKIGDECDDKNNYEEKDKQLRWLMPIGLGGGLIAMIGALWFAFKNKVDVE